MTAGARLTAAVLTGVACLACLALPARADDRADATTTYYFENRRGGQGGLSVIHPQLDLGIDIGDTVTLGAGYAADVVSGATASVYQTDAVSTATPFDDTRHEARLSLTLAGRRSSLTMFGGFGIESDYASLSAGASGNIDLPGKNTNLALSYTHNFDQVCDKENGMLEVLERQPLTLSNLCLKKQGIRGENVEGGETVWRDLSIDTVQATLTQNLSPTANVQISLYGQVLDGFQANPYRRVLVGANVAQESMPGVRGRLALQVRGNRFFPFLRSAVHASLRGYSDTWGVSSGSAELGYSQYLGSSLLFRVRSRFYQQTAATFFKDALSYETESAAGEFFTGDRELAPVRNILLGGKLSLMTIAEEGKQVWGTFDKVQFNVKADVLFLDELAANDVSDEDRAAQFLTSDQLLDVIVLQLGLLLSY